MFENKICPLVNKNTEVPGGHYWECRESTCRFQINGRCVILAGYDTAMNNAFDLEKIEKALGIRI